MGELNISNKTFIDVERRSSTNYNMEKLLGADKQLTPEAASIFSEIFKQFSNEKGEMHTENIADVLKISSCISIIAS